MSNIKIDELRPAGSEFFADAEGFMSELTEDELAISGGVALFDPNYVAGGLIGGLIANQPFVSISANVNNNQVFLPVNVAGQQASGG